MLPIYFKQIRHTFSFPDLFDQPAVFSKTMAVPEKWLMTTRQSKSRCESFAGSERTARLHISVTLSYTGVCAPVYPLVSQFVTETRDIEQQQLTLITLDGFGLNLMPIKTK